MLKPLMVNERPHWESWVDEALWPAYEDFRNFLAVTWAHLGLPPPTDAQYEIAHRLQYGYDTAEAIELDLDTLLALENEPREDIVRCFRSLGKSYITSAFAVWRLLRNPRDEKILVVSASGSKAKEFVSQTKGIINSLEMTKWLLEGHRQQGAERRDQADQFDIQWSSLSQSYSVAARGITGQITGSRATLLIADDIEIEKNSLTEESRQRLLRSVQSDFVPITKTEHGKGDIIFLGTPQTEESIYNVLVREMGFRCITIPVKYPNADKLKNYELTENETGRVIDILAPYLRRKFEAGKIRHNEPTDQRFGYEELVKIESKGRASFALQYMLDTSLSDAERYPLKQHDLMVMSLNTSKAPLTLQWGRDSDRKNYVEDISNVGFTGDHFLRPLFMDTEWGDYEGRVLFVDPAGRGKDQTAWAIVSSLNGMLFVHRVEGYEGDPAEAMQLIAQDAKAYNVNVIEVEPNFGQGMWVTAFAPVLQEVWPGGCTVQESEWARGQKEVRIIDTIEPVLTQHRLIFDDGMVRKDVKGDELIYSLLYQLTHITRERGCLRHDDKLDALAGAVAYFMRVMSQSVSDGRSAYLQQRMEDEIEDFLASMEDSPLGMRRGKRRSDGSRTEVYQRTI